MARERVARVETLLDVAVTLAWVFGGIGLLYGALASVLPPSLGLGVAFLVGTAVVRSVIGLPVSLYSTFVVERRFGFNRMTPLTYIVDRLRGGLIAAAVAIPLLFAALWIMRNVSGLWWLWTWLALVVLMAVAPAIYVRFVAPRFNRFTPLEEGPLRASIERLLAASGFRSSGLFTMDASRRTAHGNAYFIGFGRSKRIVLFDTLIAQSAPEEIEAVIAHELGHFRHKHVLYGLAQGALILFIGLAAFGWLCQQPWLLPAFGIGFADDALTALRVPAARLGGQPAPCTPHQLDLAPQRVPSRRLRTAHRRRRADDQRPHGSRPRQRLDAHARSALRTGALLASAGPDPGSADPGQRSGRPAVPAAA